MTEIQKNGSEREENSIQTVVNPTVASEPNHQKKRQSPSHLRQRLKRKSSVTATIREDHAKQPKELKTVQIATAERLNYQATSVKNESARFSKESNECGCGREDRKQYETHSPCRCHSHEPKGDCVCRSFWNKLKRFVRELFAIDSKQEKTCEEVKPHARMVRKNRNYRRQPYNRHRHRSE